MKTNTTEKKTNIWITEKFSHNPVTIKSIKNIFKLNRSLHIQNLKTYSTVGYTQIEKKDAAEIEAETRRDLGRVYANTTPIR
jgi:hypothetical protein